MHTIYVTKPFVDGLNKLRGAEKRKVQAALSDAQMSGVIALPRSDHGENRIPNVEKYKVSEGDRSRSSSNRHRKGCESLFVHRHARRHREVAEQSSWLQMGRTHFR